MTTTTCCASDFAGVVRGKPALRRYWSLALQHIPSLHFVVEDVYQGIDTIVVTYRNQNKVLVNEVLRFRDGLVFEGHGTYRIVGDDDRFSRSLTT